MNSNHITNNNIIAKNYGVSLINAPDFWKQGYKGQGTVVAVIDTGCQTDHEELKDNIIDSFNFTEDDNGDPKNVTDYAGHGTHVSGIIAAGNKNQIIGVAPQSKLLIVKAIGHHTSNAAYKALIKSIRFAINWRGKNREKVDVINLSLGGTKDDPELRNIINEALSKNIFIVAAAGNYGDGSELTDEILYPGYYEEVIQVGAVDQNLDPTPFSNSNRYIDFLGPGDAIYSTFLQNTYTKLSGTSMAAPHISGAISLLLSYFKENDFPRHRKIIHQYLKSNAIMLDGYSKNIQGNGVAQL